MPSAPTGWGTGKGGGYGKGGSGCLSNKQKACPIARPSWDYEWKIATRTYGDEGCKEARDEVRKREAEARDRTRELGEKVDLGAAGDYWEKVAVVKTVSERRAKAVPFSDIDRSAARWRGSSSNSSQQQATGVTDDPWLGIDKEITITASSSSSWQVTAAHVGGVTKSVGQVCFDHQHGRCTRGNLCRFSHGDTGGDSRDVGWAAADSWSQTGWSSTAAVLPERDTPSKGSQPIGSRPLPRPERSYTAEDKAMRAEQRKLDHAKRRAAGQAPAQPILGLPSRAIVSSLEPAQTRHAAPVPIGQSSITDRLSGGIFQ